MVNQTLSTQSDSLLLNPSELFEYDDETVLPYFIIFLYPSSNLGLSRGLLPWRDIKSMVEESLLDS